jgi:hypothetical protein
MKSTQIGKDRREGQFAQLLEASLKNQTKVEAGSYDLVTVSDITNKDFVFVQSPRGTGLIPREGAISSPPGVASGQP